MSNLKLVSMVFTIFLASSTAVGIFKGFTNIYRIPKTEHPKPKTAY